MSKKLILNHGSYLTYEEILKYKKDIEKISTDNVVFFPNILYLSLLKDMDISLGSQNFYSESEGDFIGELNLKSLKSINVNNILICTYERGKYNKEVKEDIRRKVGESVNNDFNTILTIGEDKITTNPFKSIEKELKYYLKNINNKKIKKLSISYMPNCLTSDEDINLNFIRKAVVDIKEYFIKNYNYNITVYYGNFVNENNVQDILEITDGIYLGYESINIDFVKKILNLMKKDR